MSQFKNMNTRPHVNEKEFYEWCEYHGMEYAWKLIEHLEKMIQLKDERIDILTTQVFKDGE